MTGFGTSSATSVWKEDRLHYDEWRHPVGLHPPVFIRPVVLPRTAGRRQNLCFSFTGGVLSKPDPVSSRMLAHTAPRRHELFQRNLHRVDVGAGDAARHGLSSGQQPEAAARIRRDSVNDGTARPVSNARNSKILADRKK
uniref:Uncharacterized protein n=1 Tax=Panagrolaimus sp. JU765 TaxID=591449 RepID=A0AC34QZY1_9BILA